MNPPKANAPMFSYSYGAPPAPQPSPGAMRLPHPTADQIASLDHFSLLSSGNPAYRGVMEENENLKRELMKMEGKLEAKDEIIQDLRTRPALSPNFPNIPVKHESVKNEITDYGSDIEDIFAPPPDDQDIQLSYDELSTGIGPGNIPVPKVKKFWVESEWVEHREKEKNLGKKPSEYIYSFLTDTNGNPVPSKAKSAITQTARTVFNSLHQAGKDPATWSKRTPEVEKYAVDIMVKNHNLLLWCEGGKWKALWFISAWISDWVSKVRPGLDRAAGRVRAPSKKRKSSTSSSESKAKRLKLDTSAAGPSGTLSLSPATSTSPATSDPPASSGSAAMDVDSDPKPPVDTPAVPKPPVDTPAVPKPSVDTPAVPKPSIDTPVVPKPPVDAPAGPEPLVDTPAGPEPSVDTPADPKPSVDTPAGSKHSTNPKPALATSAEPQAGASPDMHMDQTGNDVQVGTAPEPSHNQSKSGNGSNAGGTNPALSPAKNLDKTAPSANGESSGDVPVWRQFDALADTSVKPLVPEVLYTGPGKQKDKSDNTWPDPDKSSHKNMCALEWVKTNDGGEKAFEKHWAALSKDVKDDWKIRFADAKAEGKAKGRKRK
ncbi:hypothetical protein BKA70DRAFT_1467701 [Coprinopsis sp. MPI-PUGE-AT-0042]|nr:hypothetical protein BKA70DRAFT_1467701 [Coprinopsis sp. MPI-PUGE-AT-0042]